MPFSENDSVDHPISLYAASKRANELMAHTYSNLYQIPTTGLRFFTVYGPWGRPDMAPMIFTKSILSGIPINIFNNGDMSRDFTYIDDVSQAVVKLLSKPPGYIDEETKYYDIESSAPHRILNIGNNISVGLLDFVNALEKELGMEAIKDFDSLQKGDVVNTISDNSILDEWIGTYPKTSLSIGIKKFVNWYINYYK